MTLSEQYIKDLETELVAVTGKLKQDLSEIRGNRPSPDMVQNIALSLYDQRLTIRELGSLSILPPRTIQITLWDASAVAPVVKAIEAAHLGLTASNDGNVIRATLSPLGNERREEMMKLVKKMAETVRIQIRSKRDDAMKRIREGENSKELTKDDAFRAKEKMQKAVDKANADVELAVEGKIAELGE
jgi:ribosome recycling factor